MQQRIHTTASYDEVRTSKQIEKARTSKDARARMTKACQVILTIANCDCDSTRQPLVSVRIAPSTEKEWFKCRTRAQARAESRRTSQNLSPHMHKEQAPFLAPSLSRGLQEPCDQDGHISGSKSVVVAQASKNTKEARISIYPRNNSASRDPADSAISRSSTP